jgi:hypothetical protein
MAEDRASIDGSTILDNVDERQVEFRGEIGGDWYAFAMQYAVLEALSGSQITEGNNVVSLFDRYRDDAAEGAAKALARGPGTQEIIVIGESDIL